VTAEEEEKLNSLNCVIASSYRMNYVLQFTDNSRFYLPKPITPNVVTGYYPIHSHPDAQLPDREVFLAVCTNCSCGIGEVSLMKFSYVNPVHTG
jgi:hypothetical protein